MPDALNCPRCGAEPTFVAWRPGTGRLNVDPTVYRCNCGPVAVVEGDKVAWYVPMGEVERLTADVHLLRGDVSHYQLCLVAARQAFELIRDHNIGAIEDAVAMGLDVCNRPATPPERSAFLTGADREALAPKSAGGEELAVARGLAAATLARAATERAFWSAPQTAAKAAAYRTATAALKDATARFGAYYAAHPEARP